MYRHAVGALLNCLVDRTKPARRQSPVADKVVEAKLAIQHQHCILDRQVSELIEDFVEQGDFQPAGVILEHHRDPPAAPANVCHQPGDCNLGTCRSRAVSHGSSCQTRDGSMREVTAVLGEFVERMPAEIQAKAIAFTL